MSNGDSDGTRARKIAHAARRDAIGVQLQSYSGDNAGRIDLILQMQSAAEEYARLKVST